MLANAFKWVGFLFLKNGLCIQIGEIDHQITNAMCTLSPPFLLLIHTGSKKTQVTSLPHMADIQDKRTFEKKRILF